MKKYKIKYNTDSVINKTVEIKAENQKDALYLFNMNYHDSNEIVSIEEVEE